MLKKLMIFLGVLISWNVSAKAEIIPITEIEQMVSEVKQDTLVLFNIAEVLTDSSISLGTSPWRKYLKNHADKWDALMGFNVHDQLTLYTMLHVPSKPVEKATPKLIRQWQKQGIIVMALTSRGRKEWYKTVVPHVDKITENVLKRMNIDFSKTQFPNSFDELLPVFETYYRKGIIYSSHFDKGEYLGMMLNHIHYHPAKVILVDDKRDSLEEVEKMMKKMGIPFVGFWYTRTAIEHKDFDPMIAHIQLRALVEDKKLLSDKKAAALKESQYAGVDPEAFFIETITRMYKK